MRVDGAHAFPLARTASPPGSPPAGPGGIAPDRVGRAPAPDLLTPAAAAAVAAGRHQVRVVDGRPLRYPSQDLTAIESARPDLPGQSHALARHVGTSLQANVARLQADPHLRAAGSYLTAADAQVATDRTVANPSNQHAIGAFLADPERSKTALARADLGRVVGTTTFQRDVAAGRPSLVPCSTATVVLIKDATFAEGYRILTSYPDPRPPDVDAEGHPFA